MSKEKVLEKLEQFPELIKKSETEMNILSEKISNVETEMQKIEGAVMSAISNVVIPTEEPAKKKDEPSVVVGKKKFPNEITRKHELNRRLTVHEEYNECKKSFTFLKKKFEEEKINLHFLSNTFSANKYMVRLICGRDE